jgi:hypothetical protein
LPLLARGEYLALCLGVELRVQPGEYTFNLIAGEPGNSENPNVGITRDCCESLGPIVVTERMNVLMPFYGIAQLPAVVEYDFKGKMLDISE